MITEVIKEIVNDIKEKSSDQTLDYDYYKNLENLDIIDSAQSDTSVKSDT